MTPARTPAHAAAPAPARSAKVGVLTQVMELGRRWLNRRRVARLLDMDDRMLRDIGLVRSDVHEALLAREADPSSWLSAVAARSRADEVARLRACLRPDALVKPGRAADDRRLSLAA
jgi:uncharacterized protein YjiS (DUF1127 family)